MNGVGSIQKVGEQYFGLYPHVFLNPAGKLIVTGPDESDTSSSTRPTGAVSDTQDFPPFGAQGGRREWGAATLLPSGPAGPTTILMTGGSPAEGDARAVQQRPGDQHLALHQHPQRGGQPGAEQHPRPQPRQRHHPPRRLAVHERRRRRQRRRRPLRRPGSTAAELRNPATGRWNETNNQVDARTYHSTSLLIPDGRVISMGDDRG